jgi:hypothetical protein
MVAAVEFAMADFSTILPYDGFPVPSWYEVSLHGFGTFEVENDVLLINAQQLVHRCRMDKGRGSLRSGITRTKSNESQ